MKETEDTLMTGASSRLGLVLEGGGMRGIYTSGILDEFLLNGIKADGLVGVSAGILHGVSYVSEQVGRDIRYYIKLRSDKRFMSLQSLIKTGNLCETEFCYNEISDVLAPIDFETFSENAKRMEVFACTTNLATGKAEYLRLTDVREQRDRDITRASASLPMVSQTVIVDGKELMDGGIGLDCEVTLLATGLFYRSVTKYSETVYVGGKIYPYTYPYSYADVSANTLMIDSDSFADSPCKITIYGPCENPVWKHYVNNELYATGAYNGILRADHKLVIDTTRVPYSITEQGVSGEVIADRYQACDFTTKRFILLQNGTNRISLSHDGLNSVDMMVEAKISYETV